MAAFLNTHARGNSVCGRDMRINIESLDKNMKALGILESKWESIRKRLARRLMEEQDKVLRSYFAQRAGRGAREGTWENIKDGNMSASTCPHKKGAGGP